MLNYSQKSLFSSNCMFFRKTKKKKRKKYKKFVFLKNSSKSFEKKKNPYGAKKTLMVQLDLTFFRPSLGITEISTRKVH